MRYLEIDGMRVSRVGLGTWQFGSREWGYGESYARETAPALLRKAIDLGITMIDTAEVYGPHTSERIIGETLKTIPAEQRRQLVIATKFMPLMPLERIVAWQADGSRERLGMNTLDMLYIHQKNPFVSARRVMQAVRPLVEQDRVRRAAVSNFNLAQWREAEAGLGRKVVANQVRFSLVSPGPVKDLVPWAQAGNRMVVAYSPLGQGLLAGRDDFSGAGMRNTRFMMPARGVPALGPLRAAVAEIAHAHDGTRAQVALAWVLGHPNTVVIPGARTIEQLAENAAAAELDLTPGEMARLGTLADALAAS
ncbi:MAG: aldo/keto reductase [Chloroflexota bacterium]